MPSRTRLAAAALGATAAVPLIVTASSYVVRPGDSIAEIAVRHATTIEALMAANALVGAAVLVAGRMLRIPDSTLPLPGYTADGDDVEAHVVAPGEQVFQVARHHGVDASALARHNGIGVNEHLEPGAILDVPGRLGRVNALLTQVSDEVGVDGDVVRAVSWLESKWEQDTISPTGAVGLMQIEPYTGEWISNFLAGKRLDLQTARDNVRAGSVLLGHLVGIHGGDLEGALAAYYQGDASIGEHGLYDDTRRYVRTVTGLLAA